MSSNPFKNTEELKAFKTIWTGLKGRLPTTSWLFESGDFIVLCQNDIKHAEDSLPPNNLRYFEIEGDGQLIKAVTCLASKCTQRLLQHILLVSHYRVEIFKFKSGVYSLALQGSPCDLSEVKDLMFVASDDGLNDGGYSEKMLSIGPTCAIAIEGEAKAPLVGVCFWKEASKTIHMAEFYDNTSHDNLESLLIQFNPMEAVIQDQPKFRQVKKILERNMILVTHFSKKRSIAQNDSAVEAALKKKHVEGKKTMIKAFNTLRQHLNADLLGAIDSKEEKAGNAEKENEDDSYGIQIINIQDCVHLNGPALSGLNLFDTPRQAMSLFKVLNKTRTSGMYNTSPDNLESTTELDSTYVLISIFCRWRTLAPGVAETTINRY